MFAVIKYTNNMKQTNYKKSIHSLKGLFLTGLILLSSSLFGQTIDINFQPLDFSSSKEDVNYPDRDVSGSDQERLYKNVLTTGGTRIDCIVKIQIDGSSNGRTINSVNPSESDATINKFFGLDITTNENQIDLEFQFGQVDNNYDFTDFTLKNVYMNFYDVDAINVSGGFKMSENITIVNAQGNYISYQHFQASNTKYTISTSGGNVNFYPTDHNNSGGTITSVDHRWRFVMSTISKLEIKLGNRETANKNNPPAHRDFYYIDFSIGYNTTNTNGIVSSPILLDLSKSLSPSIDRYIQHDNNTPVNFDDGNSANITSSTGINPLRITIPTSNISNSLVNSSRDEFLRLGSSTTNINLNSSSTSWTRYDQTDFQYLISTNNSIRTIDFRHRNSSGNLLTVAQAESLLNDLKYINTRTNFTAGERIFNVQIRTTNGNSPIATFTTQMLTALPVDLISFTGLARTEGNQLNWTVAQEVDFSHYEVLRSSNGKDFVKIGEVYPENKSTEMKNYTFLDASVKADLAYYKLNLINEDGSSSFSNLLVINHIVVAPVITKLYPNPATTTLLVSLEGVDAEVSTITIQDLSGKIVYSTETSDVSTLLNINELNKGLYLIKVSNSNGIVSVSRFAKN
jgi:hypothetical protein